MHIHRHLCIEDNSLDTRLTILIQHGDEILEAVFFFLIAYLPYLEFFPFAGFEHAHQAFLLDIISKILSSACTYYVISRLSSS